MPSETFSYTGAEQTFTVPSWVTEVTLKIWGAGGGDGHHSGSYAPDNGVTKPGENGGYVEGTLAVTGGENLSVFVGSQGNDGTNQPAVGGDNGSGGGDGGDGGVAERSGSYTNSNAYGGGGGAASDVRQGGNTETERVAVAAGGGGGGGVHSGLNDEMSVGDSGMGGADTGEDGLNASTTNTSREGGDGGTQAAAGAGGSGNGNSGSGSSGGNGVGNVFLLYGDTSAAASGGAAGGYFGAGSGGAQAGDYEGSAGGSAGGSNYDDGLASVTSNTRGGGNAGDGQVTIEYPPEPVSDLAATGGETDADLTWTDTANEDGYDVHRSTTSGFTPDGTTLIASIAADSTSYTDADLTENTYYYKIIATSAEGDSDPSNEASAVIDFQEPTNLAESAHDATSIDVTWTDNSGAEDGYRAYYSTDGGSSFTQHGTDLAANTTSYTYDSLLNGEEYVLEVRAFSGPNEYLSNQITVTTDLPDAQAPTLDTSVENEMTATWTDVINNGSYRVQLRQSSDASWFDQEDLVGEATTSTTFTGLVDGEEYEVRMRTETAHVTGAYTAAVSATTILPAPSGLNFTGVTGTSVTVNWADNADNEDGYRVYRSREYSSGFGPETLLDTLAPGSTTYTDGTVSAGYTYQYRIEAFTEDTTNDASAQTTTTSTGLKSQRAGRIGWYVEVDHPGGTTLKPTVVGTPRRLPRLNGLPQVEVPVERNDEWFSSSFEEASMRVWYNGHRIECEEIVDVRATPAATVLVGRDGKELLERATEEFDTTDAHVAAQTVIGNTSYTANVDAPQSTTNADVTMQSADTESEFNDALPVGEPDATDPYQVTSAGLLDPFQTGYFSEGEEEDRQNGTTSSDVGSYSAGFALRLNNAGDWAEWDFSVEYTIPEASVGLAVREDNDDGGSGYDTDYYIDGNQVDNTGADFTLGWRNHEDGQDSGGSFSYTGPDLDPGTHTVRIEANGISSFHDIDAVFLYDKRFSFTFDETLDANDLLSGPGLYAPQVVTFESVSSAESVDVGTVDVVMNDTTGDQQLELTNDGGLNWFAGSNTSSFTKDFPSLGGSIQFRVTMGGYGSRTTASPTTDYLGQNVDSFVVTADLDDTPVLVDQSYDDNIVNILNDIADIGNFIWEVSRDDTGVSIEWTTPGQRTADIEPSVEWFNTKRTVEERFYKALVKGASKFRSEEQFTSNHGVAVALDNGQIVPGSEAVYDGSGTQYDNGTDYTLNNTAGEITVLSGGSMADSTQFFIDYRYRVSDTYTSPNAPSSPRELVIDAPVAATIRECGQIAINVIKQVQDPLLEVTVEVSDLDPTQSLVDSIVVGDVAMGGDRAEIERLEHSPGGVSLTLGSRMKTEEVVQRVIRRLRQASRKV